MACLYVVATPIGNLEDITRRAERVLSEVHTVVCEDTRHSGRLLARLGIRKPLISAHGHNECDAAGRVVALLDQGHDIAYVTDAGTPGISDPGSRLVAAARRAGYQVSPIPGPSAATALVSCSGFAGKGYTFEGFLSPKAGKRRTRLTELLGRGEPFVLYESPHRLLKLLAELADLDRERLILVGRELTKLHEEIVEGTAAEMLEHFTARQAVKGEVVVLVGHLKKD